MPGVSPVSGPGKAARLARGLAVAALVLGCGKKISAPNVDDAAPGVPADAALPPTPGLVYFAVSREGVVELRGGTFRRVIASQGRIDDLAVGTNGDVFAVADAQIFRAAAGSDNENAELISSKAAPGGVARRITAASDGTLWAITNKGLWAWDGAAWRNDETFPRPRTVVDIAATRGGRVVAAARDAAFIREVDGWRKVDLPAPPPEPKRVKNADSGADDSGEGAEGEGDDGQDEEGTAARRRTDVRSLALGADDRIYASTSTGIYLLGDLEWKKLTEKTVDALAIAADGTVVAAADGGEVLWGKDDGIAVREIASLGLAATEVDAVATDRLSRVWLATDGGLILANRKGEPAAIHSAGSQPALTGRIVAIRVVDAPTILPEILERRRGKIIGRLIGLDKKATANVEVEICARPDTMFSDSPCAEAPFRGAAKTDESGLFSLGEVPAGRYGFAIKKADEWVVDLTVECCAQLFTADEVKLDRIKLGD